MLGNKYVINVELGCEVEVEYEYYSRDLYMTPEEYFSRRTDTESEWIEIYAYMSLTYQNGEVVETEFSGIEIYSP